MNPFDHPRRRSSERCFALLPSWGRCYREPTETLVNEGGAQQKFCSVCAVRAVVGRVSPTGKPLKTRKTPAHWQHVDDVEAL